MRLKFCRTLSSLALVLGLFSAAACTTGSKPQARASKDLTVGTTPKNPLFSSGDIEPEGNSALHYIDSRLHELRDQEQFSVEALRKAMNEDPNSSYLHGELARNLAQGNQFEQASLEIDKALQLEPNNPNLHLLRGKLHSVKQESDSSISEYETCIRLKPDESECYIMLAREYGLQKKPEKAIATVNRLLKVDPDASDAYYYLGTLYAAQSNRTDQAVEAFKEVLERDPDDVKALASLAQLYLDNKQYPEALKVLLKIEHLAPHDIPIKLRIGLIYYEMKEFDQAIDRFNKALQLNPQNDRVSYYLGLLEAQRKNYQRALEHFKSVPPSSELYKESLVRLSFVYQELGRNAEGIHYLEGALKQRKDLPELYELLGTLYSKQGEYAKAIAVTEQGLKRFPDQERLLFSKGVLLDKHGQFEKSVETMRKVLELNPQNASAMNYIGYSYADRGIKLQEALELLTKANQIKPDDGYILDSLAWAYYKLGNYQQALQLLQKADKLSPEEPTILEHMGDVYLALEDKPKAKICFESAVSAAVKDAHPEARSLEDLKRIQSKLTSISGKGPI